MFRTACATLAAVALASAAFSLPAAAAGSDKEPAPKSKAAVSKAQQPASSLTKTGVNLNTGSTTTATQGDTIQWVVNYTNPDGNLQPATITDVIQGVPTSQTYVPGSLDVPPGFTPQWSTNSGMTFVGTDQGTATNAVRATNPAVGAPATSTSSLIAAPLVPTLQPTGGDGHTPILFTATVNGVQTPQIWNMYHHPTQPTPTLVCTLLTTGGPCTTPTGVAQTWPQALNSSVPNTLTGDLGNTNRATYVVIGSKLYYPAVTFTNPATIGVGCVDMQTQQSCGYTQLATADATGNNGVFGIVQGPNGLIYATSNNGDILCYNPVTNTPCGVFDIGLPSLEGSQFTPAAEGFGGHGGMTVINGKVYVAGTQIGLTGGVLVGCFDPVTNAACVGWNPPKLTPGGDEATTPFAMYDTAGNAIGVCEIPSTTVVTTLSCWNFAGNPIAPPVGLQALLTQNNIPDAGRYGEAFTYTAPNGHLYTEFPFWNIGQTDGWDYCYDWDIQGPCADFGNGAPGTATFPTVNGGDTRPYGFAYDGRCKYGLGDAGFLWSLDPGTGSSPCLRTTATSLINPFEYYCDGQTGHVQSYGTVTLANIDPNTVDYANSSVTVRDANNNLVGTFPFNPATQSADISSIPVTTAPISVVGDIVLLDNTSFTPNNQPVMQVNFVGDPPQVCFQTTVSDDCAVTSVSNNATAVTNGLGPVTSNTVTIQVTPSGVCLPVDLAIDKQGPTTLQKAKPDKTKSSPPKKPVSPSKKAAAK
ncbi:hypothetical protein J7E99_30665 [Streptomyces sp. ISL-44]|uniref:hypothetical protein n=1 Tax=Streptomyces sp. ISL-44 TaxID=2819184 RepID=UPI001BE7DE53|nr:hypothetical protein [Streptomyces sp. ISL-44]MBT2544950.1 hypothetical protein [Streptomyces sp. ISL-44]